MRMKGGERKNKRSRAAKRGRIFENIKFINYPPVNAAKKEKSSSFAAFEEV